MAEELFRSVVHQYRKLGGDWVDLTPMVGEPLVDPQFVSRLQYLRELGCRTAFTTNGTLLPRVNLAGVIEAKPVIIAISTTPLDRQLYQNVYRCSKYQELIGGLVALLEIRNSLASKTIISFHCCPKQAKLKPPALQTQVLRAQKWNSEVEVYCCELASPVQEP